MIDFLVEILIKPFFNEKLRVFKYYDQKCTAQRMLRNANPNKKRKGLSLLSELAISYPYRVQEIINEITSFLRMSFPQDMPINKELKDIVELALRSLTSIPRLDQNGFPYNFDIHQIRIEGIDLTRSNFKYFSLWGCKFTDVILSHSTFEEVDLGGTVFENCSLEYANFHRTKMCGSFMDNGRPTTFNGTRLWGTNLKDAEIEFCVMDNFDKINLQQVENKIIENKLKIIS